MPKEGTTNKQAAVNNKKAGNGKEQNTNSTNSANLPNWQFIGLLLTIFAAMTFNMWNNNAIRSDLTGEIRQLRGEVVGIRGDIQGMRDDLSDNFSSISDKFSSINEDIDLVGNRVTRVESRLGFAMALPLQVTAIIAPSTISLGETANVQVAFTNVNLFPMENVCRVFLTHNDEPVGDSSQIFPLQLGASENRTLIFQWQTDQNDTTFGTHNLTVGSDECPGGINKASAFVNIVAAATPTLTATPAPTPTP